MANSIQALIDHFMAQQGMEYCPLQIALDEEDATIKVTALQSLNGVYAFGNKRLYVTAIQAGDYWYVALKPRAPQARKCHTPYGQYCTKCGILHIDTRGLRGPERIEKRKAAYIQYAQQRLCHTS
jgi:hypothetical protein